MRFRLDNGTHLLVIFKSSNGTETSDDIASIIALVLTSCIVSMLQVPVGGSKSMMEML